MCEFANEYPSYTLIPAYNINSMKSCRELYGSWLGMRSVNIVLILVIHVVNTTI